jgi:hypothetical protein
VAELRTLDENAATSSWIRDIEVRAMITAQELGAIQNVDAEATFEGSDQPVTVTVTGDVVDLIPGWDLTVEASASGLVETFRPDLGEEEP